MDEFALLDDDFVARRIDAPEYSRRAYRHWHRLTDEVVRAEGAHWLAGIRQVWADIRERGEHCAVISLSPGSSCGG